VVPATLFPFPAAGSVKAPLSSGSTTGAPAPGKFADAMDGALDAHRPARRTDSASRSSRRTETSRTRDAADTKAAAPSQKADPGKAPAAKKSERADETAVEEKPRERATEVSSECAPADQPQAPREDAKAGEASEQNGGDTAETATDEAVDEAVEAVEASAVAVATLLGDEDGGGESVAAQGDSVARGRRWETPAAEQADERSETVPNGVAAHPTNGAPGLKIGHPIAKEAPQPAAPQGDVLAELAQHATASAQAQAAAIPAAATTDAPVTDALETAKTAPQSAAKADGATIIENAIAAVETVESAESTAGADTTESETHEQAQPKPQMPSRAGAGETPVVGGPSDGVRFTVAGAAGSAAYVNAAPRQEEAVLPQIVQSIRLQAVQGTTEARVQLKPEHLGALNITLKVVQNQVTATIQADVAAVRQWIESHEASLRQALSEQGLELAKLVVHQDGQQASQSEEDGERPRRQPRRRSWRDQDATFEVLV
jgi:flagellar hook-length control protein FliK